jgi:uroporphyrin-III C-methyltransferase
VAIVGAGPGDPELLTRRAEQRIAAADDLVVDALVPPLLYQDAPGRVIHVGKRAGRPSIDQRGIERILIRLARAGRQVVRLKGGDPSVFGRVGEEIRALEDAGIPVELVPGVSSLTAAPLALGVGLTERGVADRMVVLTGHRAAEGEGRGRRLPAYDPEQTVVLLMALGSLEDWVAAALEAGYPRDLPAAVVADASLPTERLLGAPLGELAMRTRAAGFEPPATVLFGRVAAAALSVGLEGVDVSRQVGR